MKKLDLTLLYLRKDDHVLLAMKKRGFGKGKWNGVGGKIEPQETTEQALVRECQEEIGCTPTAYNKVGELVFNEHHDGERKLMNLHIYIASKWEGVISESEEMKPEWFDIHVIPYDLMWPADKEWLPMVLKGETIGGEFTLHSDNTVKSRTLYSKDIQLP
jgi:mutator protein MutT